MSVWTISFLALTVFDPLKTILINRIFLMSEFADVAKLAIFVFTKMLAVFGFGVELSMRG